MEKRVLVHSVDQPESDITAYILSCNRIDVLDVTINSFLVTKQYETKVVIVDDSAEQGVFDTLVDKYGSFADIICFPKNRGQWWAMDFMVSYCDTDYIFYVEDDWQFVNTGYLAKSKHILETYRDIGNIDISWRTFENENFQTYEPELIDDMFFYKKMWRISNYHYHWYGWTGSPNLKRRDDLILLGRVEKWHNEWNIDRRFLALGLKSVFLYGQHVFHTGDNCSRMDAKRPSDSTTPEHYYPAELQKNRVWPVFNYLQWDNHWNPVSDITLVTSVIDVGRTDRQFEQFYVDGMYHLLQSRHPIVIFTEHKYIQKIEEFRNGKPTKIIVVTSEKLVYNKYFNDLLRIKTHPTWIEQDPAFEGSILLNDLYVMMTLMKMAFLQEATQYVSQTNYMYWVDAAIYPSSGLHHYFDSYYFSRIPKDKFFITSVPYNGEKTISGYDATTIFGNSIDNSICKTAIFGGTLHQIQTVNSLYRTELEHSLMQGLVGTADAFFTILSLKYPNLLNVFKQTTTDLNEFFDTLLQST